jgi:hypothetical protein
MKNVYKILVRKPEEKITIRRPRSRWEDNIKIYLKEIEYEILAWIHLAQERAQWQDLLNTVMNFRVSQKKGNFF